MISCPRLIDFCGSENHTPYDKNISCILGQKNPRVFFLNPRVIVLFLLSTWHFYYYHGSKMPDFWLGRNCWAWYRQTSYFSNTSSKRNIIFRVLRPTLSFLFLIKHKIGPSVCYLILPWQPAPPCFQGLRRTGPARPPLGRGSTLAGSCSTRWSTTHPCWAPGSTFRRRKPVRASWMGPQTTAPRKAARKRLISPLL